MTALSTGLNGFAALLGGAAAAVLAAGAQPAWSQDGSPAVTDTPPAEEAERELPPVPDALMDHAGVACVGVGADGAVHEAVLVTSTGAPARDATFLAWVRQMRWPPTVASDRSHLDWLPVAVAFGGARSPPAPDHCSR